MDIPIPFDKVGVPKFVDDLSDNRYAYGATGTPAQTPEGFTYWRSAACAPTHTLPHHDAGGCATWVKMVAGTKLWMVAAPIQKNHVLNLATYSIEDDLRRDDKDKIFHWYSVILRTGDLL